MIQTIRVVVREEKDDSKGSAILSELGKTRITTVRTARLYRLEGISTKDARELADKLLCESIHQKYSLNIGLSFGGNKVEIAYKPGVMNPEVASIIKGAKDLGITLAAADVSWEYYFVSKEKNNHIIATVKRLNLYNPIIEYIVAKEPHTLLITGHRGIVKKIPIRHMTDKQLELISKDKLFLNLEEMKVIQNYFVSQQRDPTDCELETLAQTWSEHCSHKTFKANLIVDGKRKQPLITRLKKEALKHKKLIVSAFVDNSGVMKFYENMSICGKVETHNSPSAIEPYGGAMTGSGGVFRDIVGTGQGAKTIASTDMFCFAPVSLPKKDLPKGCLPPEYLFKRVVTGVRDYGNRIGIPTNNGSVHFHEDFRAKPTIIVGAYGIIPTKKALKGTVKNGDVVIIVGGRTGRDGIHGATFSSAEMNDKTISTQSSAVQIGNAIEEKRMFDALLEARDADLIRAIQDCGAGGFSSAIGEMGEKIGVTVDLAKVPLKYHGLQPWEIWVSESQERMVVAVDKKNISEFQSICKKYNVESVVLGDFGGSKKLHVYYGKELICDIDMEFLYNGLPQRTMVANEKRAKKEIKKKRVVVPASVQGENLEHIFSKILSHGNVCSKEAIIRQYDHTVQGTNIVPPYSGLTLEGPNDAAVVRPLLHKSYGMVIAHGLNPVLNTIDAYWGSVWAIVEALSNYVAVGGNPKEASLINNYIWPFPDEESLWTLNQSVEAVIQMMRMFDMPIISGKDSLSSTYRSPSGEIIKIPPVLCMSIFGRIADVSKTVTSDLKQPGSVVFLIGKQDNMAMGGSVYYQILKLLGGPVPRADVKTLPEIFEVLHSCMKKNAILASHDSSEGGILTALFEMCIGGNLGVDVVLPSRDLLDTFLFNETPGCFLVEVQDEMLGEKLFADIPHILLARTREQQTISLYQKRKLISSMDIHNLQKIWKQPMEKIFTS